MNERISLEAAIKVVEKLGEMGATPIGMIAAERKRQIEAEGWHSNHDDHHDLGELAQAAAYYAVPSLEHNAGIWWPWDVCWNKRHKHSRPRQLVIAGALIVAEIERLQRLEPEGGI